ncbi:MAG: Spy/CpxP family protein refolding chaperone [Opitutaceae bacterium]|nr:Spy/CpxP family protein refolding chaperone [Opitutaceae bacterium]
MTSLKTILLSLTTAATLGSLVFAVDSTAPSTATPPAASSDGPRNRIERLMKFAAYKLELSETQVTALKEIFTLHQPELQPLLERARTEREELRSLVAAGTLDEAALEAQAAKIAETTKALTIASAHLRSDLRAVLTPEQVDTLMQARRHGAARRQHGREAVGHRINAP